MSRVSRSAIVALTLSAVMVLAAGCTGWGSDGPLEPEEADGNGEAQAEEEEPEDDVETTDDPAAEEADDDGDSDESSSKDPPGEDADRADDAPPEDDGDGDEERDRDDEAEETRSVTVEVYDEDGDPVSGEVVLVGTPGEEDEYRTDADGTVVVEYGPPHADAFQQQVIVGDQEKGIVLDDRDPHQTVTFTVDAAPETHTLYATIVDATAAGPIEGTVTVDGETEETDADHGAEFELEDGTYTVTGETADGEWHVEEREVTIDGEDERIGLSANPIRTLAVDVGEADVDVTLERGSDGATTTRSSGGDGIVEFSVIPGSYALSADGYEATDVAVPDDREPETVEMEPEDEEVHTLTVEATSPVTLERTWEDAQTTREPTDGTVEFSVVEGSYALSADGYHDVSEELAIQVDSDTTVTLQSEDGGEIEVTVVDAETGEGIEGAEISGVCNWYYSAGDVYITGETDADGVANAHAGLAPTDCDATVSAEGYESESVSLAVPDDDGLTVELEPEESETNTLTVEVTDAETGESIEGATVEAYGADGDPDDTRELRYEAVTDESGVAEMDVVAAMNYVISVEAEGYDDGHGEVSLDREKAIELDPEGDGNAEANSYGNERRALV